MELTTLQQNVVTAIKDSNPTVVQQVTDFLVNKEVSRRVTAVTSALAELDKLEKDGYKIKPDVVTYDLEGKVATEGFTKAKVDERKKLNEKIAKYKKALEKALNDNEFGDLFNLGSKDNSEEKKAE